MVKENLSLETIQKIEDVILAIGKDAGVKAFDHVALDRVEWVANAIYQCIRRAKDEVVEKIFDPSDKDCTIDEVSKEEILSNLVSRGDDPLEKKKFWSEETKDEIIARAKVKSAKEKEVENKR